MGKPTKLSNLNDRLEQIIDEIIARANQK